MSVTLHLPSSDEQKKRIADFLKKIDKRIAVQERLLASLKKYKRGFVSAILSHQIMFSDVDGKSYPKWINLHVARCSGFSRRDNENRLKVQTEPKGKEDTRIMAHPASLTTLMIIFSMSHYFFLVKMGQ